jgi:hypothetical protein
MYHFRLYQMQATYSLYKLAQVDNFCVKTCHFAQDETFKLNNEKFMDYSTSCLN